MKRYPESIHSWDVPARDGGGSGRLYRGVGGGESSTRPTAPRAPPNFRLGGAPTRTPDSLGAGTRGVGGALHSLHSPGGWGSTRGGGGAPLAPLAWGPPNFSIPGVALTHSPGSLSVWGKVGGGGTPLALLARGWHTCEGGGGGTPLAPLAQGAWFGPKTEAVSGFI